MPVHATPALRRLPEPPTGSFAGRVVAGKYRIESPIAKGGMGSIYLATQALLGRSVALKMVRADAESDPQVQTVRRFVQEARMLGRLQHPNVVTVFDFGRVEDAAVETYFIAMEYLAGPTLGDYLSSRGPLSCAEAIAILMQIARGLRAAHAQGIVHRDLKPSNLLIVKGGDGDIIKIVDFGVGKDCFTDEALTLSGAIIGTPRFMAPEQFSGLSSPASDVYALGMIAYVLLTGGTPFVSTQLQDLLSEKLRRPLRPMHERAPGLVLSEGLERLVYEMLSMRPEHRPVIDDVLTELAELSSCQRNAPHAGHVPMTGLDDRSLAPTRPVSHARSEAPPPALAPLGRDSRTTQGPRWRLRLAMGAVLLSLFAMGACVPYWLFAHPPSATPKPMVDAAAAAKPIKARSFRLYLESIPTGATVSEDGRTLGTTPLVLTLDRATLPPDELRVFRLEEPGFQPTLFAQTDSEQDVTATVALSPATPPPPVAGASSRSPGATTPKPRLTMTPPPDRGIYLQR